MVDYVENVARIVEVGWSVETGAGLYVLDSSDVVHHVDPVAFDAVLSTVTLSGVTAGSKGGFDANESSQFLIGLSSTVELFDSSGTKTWSKGLEAGETAYAGWVLAQGYAWTVSRKSSQLTLQKRQLSDGAIVATGTIATASEFSASQVTGINATSLGSLIAVIFTATISGLDDFIGRTFSTSTLAQASTRTFQTGIDYGSYNGFFNYHLHRGPSQITSDYVDFSIFASDDTHALDSVLADVPADHINHNLSQTIGRQVPATATDKAQSASNGPFYFYTSTGSVFKYTQAGTLVRSVSVSNPLILAITPQSVA